MSNLVIAITIDSLSALTPVAPHTYQVYIEFRKADGSPLGNANIPNNYTATVDTTSTSFSAVVPIVTGVYTIPNVTIKIYANENQDCCFATISGVTIDNPGDGEEDEDNSMGITGYYGN